MRKIIGPLVTMLLGGCSFESGLPTATKAAEHFHQQLNAGHFSALYAAAAPELRAQSSETDFDALLDAIHRKLGKFKSDAPPVWNEQVTTAGHFVTLVFRSAYERGPAEENFVYRIADGGPVLMGYHINSQALIVN